MCFHSLTRTIFSRRFILIIVYVTKEDDMSNLNYNPFVDQDHKFATWIFTVYNIFNTNQMKKNIMRLQRNSSVLRKIQTNLQLS